MLTAYRYRKEKGKANKDEKMENTAIFPANGLTLSPSDAFSRRTYPNAHPITRVFLFVKQSRWGRQVGPPPTSSFLLRRVVSLAKVYRYFMVLWVSGKGLEEVVEAGGDVRGVALSRVNALRGER